MFNSKSINKMGHPYHYYFSSEYFESDPVCFFTITTVIKSFGIELIPFRSMAEALTKKLAENDGETNLNLSNHVKSLFKNQRVDREKSGFSLNDLATDLNENPFELYLVLALIFTKEGSRKYFSKNEDK